MATLQTPGDIKSVSFVDIKSVNKTASLWVVNLRSSSDLLMVPGLDSTSAIGSLTSGISVANYYLYAGQQSPIVITGGSSGTQAVIAALHRRGLINHLSKDETPT